MNLIYKGFIGTCVLVITTATCVAIGAEDILKNGPKGSVGSGPGSGQSGVMTLDAPSTIMQFLLDAVEETVDIATATYGKSVQEKQKQQNEFIRKAMGDAKAGEHIDPLTYSIDPIQLATRQKMLEWMKAARNSADYSAFIQYLDTLQSHEARTVVYIQRVNNLLKIHESKMNLQERIKYAAELGLMQGQLTLAEEEMREARNRAVIDGVENRKRQAVEKLARSRAEATAEMMLGAPSVR
jgi:hypothetical protein